MGLPAWVRALNLAMAMPDTPEPPKTLPLVIEEPRGRRQPPRHLADLDPA